MSFGDRICRGCKRFEHEVLDWNRYGDAVRSAVIDRLERQQVRLLQPVAEITDPQLLASALRQRGIAFNDALDPACWVFALLRRAAADSLNPAQCGLRLRVALTLEQVWHRLDSDMYRLAEVQYQRYCQHLRPSEPGA